MSSPIWAEVAVEIAPAAEEAISHRLVELGAAGVQIEALPPDRVRLIAHFPKDPALPERLAALEAALAALPRWGLPAVPARTAVRDVEPADWAEAWKAHYRPLRVGPFGIVPSWERRSVAGARYVIELDPGMAFGTGLHPTTQLCLEAIGCSVRAGDAVWDVGTGSGICAIAAARLGAEVWAVDIDPVAVNTARRNVAGNGVDDRVRVLSGTIVELCAAARAASAKWRPRIIVMNILPDVICEAAPVVREILSDGGVFFTSGITLEREGEVRAALRAARFAVRRARRRQGWTLIEAHA
ncbi:MAG TPA: 50S ribosomal protein L11 methyltransferase [Limnochordia bacterium]